MVIWFLGFFDEGSMMGQTFNNMLPCFVVVELNDFVVFVKKLCLFPHSNGSDQCCFCLPKVCILCLRICLFEKVTFVFRKFA